MPYSISADKCIGCQLCSKKCPVNCIDGKPKQPFTIYESLCIECGVCASYCPVDNCILDQNGLPRLRITPKERPYATVDESLCAGCEGCISVCPFGCLEMKPLDGYFHKVADNVQPRDCVGCKLCEDICSQKGAIKVVAPDGTSCDVVGVSARGPFREGTRTIILGG